MPAQQTITVSSTQPNYSNINFSDNSAIDINGYVFYENSTIPVKDATFEINGSPVTSNGKYIKSDENGYFKFSVPVGEQTVKIIKENHDGLLSDE